MPVDILEYAPEWVQEFKRCEQYIEAALEHAHGTFTVNSVFEDFKVREIQMYKELL